MVKSELFSFKVLQVVALLLTTLIYTRVAINSMDGDIGFINIRSF